MNAETETLASRIKAEVDRALQRNIKGLDYLTSQGPTMGVTPRDVIHQRGTLALYRYRPLADEIYRVPLLLVMALTNRGYILDLAPGQSLVEFLLRQGYDVFVIDWNPPRPDETRLRLEDYTLDFIPDCVARVQQAQRRAGRDAGRLLHGRGAVDDLRRAAPARAGEEPGGADHADRLPRDEAVQPVERQALLRCRQAGRCHRQCAAGA